MLLRSRRSPAVSKSKHGDMRSTAPSASLIPTKASSRESHPHALNSAGLAMTVTERRLVLRGILERATRLGGDGVQMVGERWTVCRREEVVEEDELLCPVPVVRQILGQELRVGPTVRGLVPVESVHLPVVPGLDGAVVAVRDVGSERPSSRGGERALHLAVHTDGHPVRPGEAAEHVIEGSVLLDDVDDALDRERGLEGIGVDTVGGDPHRDRWRPARCPARERLRARREDRPGSAEDGALEERSPALGLEHAHHSLVSRSGSPRGIVGT